MNYGRISVYSCRNYNMPLYVENIGSFEITVRIDMQFNYLDHRKLRSIDNKIYLILTLFKILFKTFDNTLSF